MQHIKRILSLALALVMVLSLVPTIAFAADSTPALPAAKVYQTKNDDLTFALNFRINTVSEEQLAYYGNWYADFELTVNKEVTFNSDGSADGWLSGQYDEWSYDWVNVPFGNNASVTLQANETVKIMAFAAEYMNKAGLKYTFKEVYETVKDFYCGVYFDDAFLAANPDLVVTLELKMYNPADATESYVVGETYTFTNPIVAQNVNTGKVYAGVNEAMMDAQANETVIVLKDTTESILTVYTDTTLDLNGYTLAASYVSCFGDIIDSSAANSGLLAVPTNRFLVRNDNVQLPVRNGNGYRFVEVLGFNTTMDGPTKFVFQPLIETGALAWLKAGTDASGVTIQVQISWMQSDGLRTQDFVYNDSLLVEFIDSHKGGQSYRKVFTLTLNGVENIEALTFTAVVVSENGVSFTPDTLRQPKPTGNVTTNSQNQVVNDVTIGNGNASALVPSGTQLESGANNVTLSATAMEKTTSNITVSDGEQLISMNVHVNGVAANNTTPIIVTLNELAPEALNQGNVNLYHVENGETVLMTRVYSLAEVDAHNEYYYDIATGTVTMALATFSEIAVLSDNENGWNGNFNYEWYNTTDIEFEIYNADQLAALGAIVGGMAEGIERDSFKGKTIKLLADINLADAEDDGKIFYPIGYWNNTLSYEHVSGNPNDTAVSSGFYPFEGTFDGNGNTISNFYQNTWEMFGDYNDGYSGTPNYYRDGMGLFGKVYGGTVMNLTVDNFESDGEFTTTGCIAAYADCGAVFQNISITNCNPRVYNIGNGGIVGCVGWYAKEADTKVTFENITVDNTNIISALWGSWDVACGGIVGQYYPTSGQTVNGVKPSNGGIDLINCHVAAQIDVYNDVCANYQYYAYRYSGMLIGSVRENVTGEDGHSYPKMDGITATGCSVFFGDWNDYYYCELVANSLASYTHDHQMSRLTQVLSVDVDNMTVTKLDGTVSAIPESGRYNYVVVKNKDPETGAWLHDDGTEFAECFHFVNGDQHFHDVADDDNPNIYETVNGVEVLKEDKQLIYREFNNLVTGYGWGVTSRGFNNLGGVENFGVVNGKGEDSIVKFVPVVGAGTSLVAGQPISIGKLFAANTGIASVIDINNSNVQVFVSPADETSTARGSFVGDEEDWTKGALVLRGTGKAVVTITDYYYCTATTLVVDVLRDDAVVTNTPAANVIPNSTFGDLKNVTSYPFTSTTGIGYSSAAFANITADITDRYASEGTYSMHLVHSATKSAGSVYQDIPITADMIDKELVLSVDRRGTSDEKMTYMHLQFYGLGDTGKADQVLGRSDYSFFKSSATWVTSSVKVTVPKDAVMVRAYIAYIKTGSTADVYFDNVVLTCDGEPIALTNPSFDTMLPSGTPNETNEFALNAEEWKPSAPDNCIVSVQTEPGNETNGILVFEDHNDQKYARADTYYLPVIPGQSYTLSFRFKASENTQGAQIRVYIRGGNNEYLMVNPKGGNPVASDFSEIATTEWSICTKETIVIPDTVNELYVTLTASTDDGILYMDDFILTANCSIHTWGEADVIEAATCTVAGTSVRACVNCGATETVSAKIAHAWDNGVCGSCGIDCEHDVYGGVCLICKAELPEVEHDNLIDNGTFDNDAGWNPSPKDTSGVRYATITDDERLYLYDNDLTAYPQAWYGGADKKGIPIKEGKTYIFKLEYEFDPNVKNVDKETAGDKYADFQLTIALRANQSGSVAGVLGGQSVKFVSDGNTKGVIEIPFTVDYSKTTQWDKDGDKNPLNPPTTFYVMLYTNKAASGAVWVDNISLVEACDSHSWILSDVKDPTCTDAGVRTVKCEHCGITATSEIPALGHHWPNGFCVRCHEKKEELM